VTEQGRGEAGRLAARGGHLGRDRGQVFLGSGQFRADAGLQGGPDPLGELIERQAPGQKVLAQRSDGPLAIGV
jgi:hypothetical protein